MSITTEVPSCWFSVNSYFCPKSQTTLDLPSVSIDLPFLKSLMNGTIQYVVFLWLFSLSIIFWIIICIVACTDSLSLLLSSIPLYRNTTVCFHAQVDGHVDFSQSLSLMKNAGMNFCILVFVWTEMKFLDYMENNKNCQTVFQGSYIIIFSHQQCRRVPSSPHQGQHLLLSYIGL